MIVDKLLTENIKCCSSLAFTPSYTPARIEIRGVIYNRKSDLTYSIETIVEKLTT